MSVNNWMPFFIGDYLGGTQRLTTEQHGAYLLLIFDYWRNGPPPLNDAILCSISRLKLARFRKHKETLLGFFEVRDGKLFHARIDAEKNKAEQRAAKFTERAKVAADARWHDTRTDAPSNASSMPQAMLEQCPPSPPYSVPTEQPGKVDPRKRVFDDGVALLVRTGSSAGSARSFIGSLRKSATDDKLSALIAEAIRLNISEPKSWLTAALAREASEADALSRSIDRIYPERKAA